MTSTHYFVSTGPLCYIPPDGKVRKWFSFERRKLIGTSYTRDPDDTTVGPIRSVDELKKKIHLLDTNIPIIAEFYERPMLIVQCGIAHSELIRYIDTPHIPYYYDWILTNR